MQLLLAALLTVLGPHAADAELHAQDAEAQWVRAAPPRQQLAATAPALARRVYGYLPYWESLDLAAFNWDLISDVVAFSAGVGTDGTVSNTHALPGAALVSAAHAHGVKVHLCATLFNSSGGSEIATFLGSAAAQSKTVSQLLAIATSSGLDGLNLDFEFVPSGSRAQFTAFVRQLHTALRSALPAAEVTLAMPADTGYTGYDAKGLAAVSERLLLMEYDYHWRTAPTSGANAPLPPVESAVGGFLAEAPASALAMGVPYYGYDWPTTTASPGSANSTGGATVLFEAAFGKFSTYGRLWDSASQTPWYRYSLNGQEHQGWVDDGQSLALKYQFVNARNLAGIMIWALGYDAGRTESWDAIKTAFGSAPPPPPTSPGVLHLVSATFSPATLDPGGTVTATLHVKNVGGQTIAAALPPPSTVYDETQAAASAAPGSFRVAVDAADRAPALPAHPWRWGLAAPLAPGAEVDLAVQLKLERTGTRTLWAAVVHEGVDVPQDYVGQTDLAVAPPASPDAGSPGGGASDAGLSGSDGGHQDPPAGQVRGCAQAGGGPWLSIVAALALVARRRLRNAAKLG